MLNPAKQRRFVVYMVTFLCAMACLYLLWHKQFSDLWVVVSGAAYIYFDRIHKEDNEDDNE